MRRRKGGADPSATGRHGRGRGRQKRRPFPTPPPTPTPAGSLAEQGLRWLPGLLSDSQGGRIPKGLTSTQGAASSMGGSQPLQLCSARHSPNPSEFPELRSLPPVLLRPSSALPRPRPAPSANLWKFCWLQFPGRRSAPRPRLSGVNRIPPQRLRLPPTLLFTAGSGAKPSLPSAAFGAWGSCCCCCCFSQLISLVLV